MRYLALLFALLTITSAQANGYIGIGIGQSKVGYDSVCSEISSSASCNSKDSDAAIKLIGGNQFSEHGAFEFSYIDFGKITTNVSASIGSAAVKTKANGFDLGLIGFFPINDQLSLLGRVGIFFWSLDQSGSIVINGTPGIISATESGNSISYGIGAKYDFSKSVSLRGEFQRFPDLGESNTTGQWDIDLISVNIVFYLQ